VLAIIFLRLEPNRRCTLAAIIRVCDRSIVSDGRDSIEIRAAARRRFLMALYRSGRWTDRRVRTFSRNNADHSDMELSAGDALSCWLVRIHLYLRGRRRNFADNMADTTPGFSTRHSDTLSLFLSLFLLSSPLARTAFILLPPFPRRREPPTCPAK